MDEQGKFEAITAHLKDWLSEFTLEYSGQRFETGNRFLRFYRKGQSLRVEITREALGDENRGAPHRAFEALEAAAEGRRGRLCQAGRAQEDSLSSLGADPTIDTGRSARRFVSSVARYFTVSARLPTYTDSIENRPSRPYNVK